LGDGGHVGGRGFIAGYLLHAAQEADQ
jgi:hypothetical protein